MISRRMHPRLGEVPRVVQARVAKAGTGLDISRVPPVLPIPGGNIALIRQQDRVRIGGGADRHVGGLGARRCRCRRRHSRHRGANRGIGTGAVLSSRTSLNEPKRRCSSSAASCALPSKAASACRVASSCALRWVSRDSRQVNSPMANPLRCSAPTSVSNATLS